MLMEGRFASLGSRTKKAIGLSRNRQKVLILSVTNAWETITVSEFVCKLVLRDEHCFVEMLTQLFREICFCYI